MKDTATPGPWKWDKGIDDEPNRCFVTQGIPGQPEYLIATIENGAPGDSLDTEEANARLIAAAPDLLAALKAVEFRGHGMDRCPMCSGWNASPNGETPYAHSKDCALAAAISAAEGRLS